MTKQTFIFIILALFAISGVAQIRPVTRPVRTQQNQQQTQPVRQQSAQPARQNNVQQQSQPARQQQAQPVSQQQQSVQSVQTTQPAQTSTTSSRDKILANLAADMVYVEGGTFTMGATEEQGDDAFDNEKPHQVTLSSFYICKHEVTQEEWEAVMGSNPSNWKGKRLPVEKVSWEDCQTFINKLNSLTGKQYRLPTEAEWEYAARGGNRSQGYKYSGSNTLDNVAWYDDNSGDRTHEVMKKSPNELGLYDMSGNVWEWCQDWYGSYSSSAQTNPKGASSGSERVWRGGSWYFSARYCRVSSRYDNTPSARSFNHGLRLAL